MKQHPKDDESKRVSAAYDRTHELQASDDQAQANTHPEGEETQSINQGDLGSEFDLSLHEPFGRFEPRRVLGQGAMGVVYLAKDTNLDRLVALKLPKIEKDPSGSLESRFRREAKAVAAIQHPNICPIYDLGKIDEKWFISMAYVEGKPLSKYLKRGRPTPERQCAILCRKLALGMQEAHNRGVLHRDLKPANIMIDERKQPIVMDFGLARRNEAEDTTLTQKGMFIGTPAYTSPEQIRNLPDTVGPATDIYAIGVILYEMLTGQLPFESDNVMSMLGQILADEPPTPRERNPKLDSDINRICLCAMAKDPNDRFASMKDFADALATFIRGETTQTHKERGGIVELEPLPKSATESGHDQVGLTELPIDFLSTSPSSESVAVTPQISTKNQNSIRLSRGRNQPSKIALLVAIGLGSVMALVVLGIAVVASLPDRDLAEESNQSDRDSSSNQNGNESSDRSVDNSQTDQSNLPDQVVFEDFESGTYEGWEIEGNAFNQAPSKFVSDATKELMAGWSEELGFVACSNSDWGSSLVTPGGNRMFGKLTSQPFTITHPYICFTVFGANQPFSSEVRLEVDGQVEHRSSGDETFLPIRKSWNVSSLIGKQARIVVNDGDEGSDQRMGFIAVDNIVFSKVDDVVAWKDALSQRIENESVSWNGNRYWFPNWQTSAIEPRASLDAMERIVGSQGIVIDSKEENDFITEHLRGPTWLGIRNNGDGRWVNSRGEPASYFNWMYGRPAERRAKHSYIDRTGVWNDGNPTGLYFRCPLDERAFVAFKWRNGPSSRQSIEGADKHRELAESVLQQIEWIELQAEERFFRISHGEKLPSEDFELIRIRFQPGTEISNQQLSLFQQFNTVNGLEFPSATESAMRITQYCPNLTDLWMSWGGVSGTELQLHPECELVLLQLEGWKSNADWYSRFQNTRTIRSLTLAGHSGTGNVLQYFIGNTNLQLLNMWPTSPRSPEEIELVSRFVNMRNLYLRGCGLDDDTLVCVREMRDLRTAHLGHNPGIKGPGLINLENCQDIGWLSFYETSLGNDCARYLPLLPQLEFFEIGATNVNVVDQEILTKIPSLRKFYIQQTRIDDRSLQTLARIPELRELLASDSLLSDSGLNEIKSNHSPINVRR